MHAECLMAGGFASLIGSLIGASLIRDRIIVPAIRDESRYSVGISISTIYVEAREYRRHCVARGESLRWWRAWWFVHALSVASIGASLAGLWLG